MTRRQNFLIHIEDRGEGAACFQINPIDGSKANITRCFSYLDPLILLNLNFEGVQNHRHCWIDHTDARMLVLTN
jgi:hypothetical protein